MNRTDRIFKEAFDVIVSHVDAKPNPIDRFELAGAFMFASADVLKNLIGDEMTLDGLRTIIDALEERRGGMQ